MSVVTKDINLPANTACIHSVMPFAHIDAFEEHLKGETGKIMNNSCIEQ